MADRWAADVSQCPRGHFVPDDAAFCPDCGAAVKAPAGLTDADLLWRATEELRARSQTPMIVALLSAGALAVGSFLPWAKLVAPFVGTITKSGVEGSDGWVTLAAAAVIASLAMSWAPGRSGAAVGWMFIAAAAAGAMVLWEVNDLSSRFASVDADLVATSYGSGLYLCGLGAAGAMVAGFMRSSQ